MTYLRCSIPEQYVNLLFEVFDGGDFVLSSYRDIKKDLTEMRIFLEDPAREDEARRCLQAAMALVGVTAPVEKAEIVDEDWRLSYRRHFKTEPIGQRVLVVPEWELEDVIKAGRAGGRTIITLDPGLAFGTGKHETTHACLEYIDELSQAKKNRRFLDMGCGSGILSIAARKLGYAPVLGFDVDQEAVDASIENAAKNDVDVKFVKFALGRPNAARVTPDKADLVAANILGPLLIRFVDEIVPYVGDKLIISGILTELYPEVVKAYEARGLKELSHKTLGEWTTGLMQI